MKKIITISAALILGCATTSFAIPVREFNTATDNGVQNLNENIAPMSFSLNENSSVSFEGIASGARLDTNANSLALTNWTPNWFNSSSLFNRPDWGNFYYDLYSYFSYCPKNNPGGPPNTVPEPATILLLGSGLIGLACISRKRMKS